MDGDCLFCKIAQGGIPSYKVYEDADILVILDRFPSNTGECLVLTKRHFENLFDLDPALGAKIFEISRRVALKIKDVYSIDGLNLLQNNGEPAGQQINHFHLHVIPRFNADSVVIHGKATNPPEEEFLEAAAALRL